MSNKIIEPVIQRPLCNVRRNEHGRTVKKQNNPVTDSSSLSGRDGKAWRSISVPSDTRKRKVRSGMPLHFVRRDMNHSLPRYLSNLSSSTVCRSDFQFQGRHFGDGLQALSKDLETAERKKKKQHRRLCPVFSPCFCCCCLATSIGAILLLMALAGVLTYIFTSKPTTTTTTSITITPAMTDTSTLLTITPTPPCTPTSVGSATTLYTATNGSNQYTCLAYAWTSPTTGPVALAFELRNDPSIWNVDDVTVYAGATAMLNNTGFETGSLSPWVRTTPSGMCSGLPGVMGALSVLIKSGSPGSGIFVKVTLS